MAEYTYRCPNCNQTKDVTHSMSECDSPSEATVTKITCNEYTCHYNKINEVVYGQSWIRVPQESGFLSFGSGDRNKGGTLSREEKHARLQKRADMPNKRVDDKKKFDNQKFVKDAKEQFDKK